MISEFSVYQSALDALAEKQLRDLGDVLHHSPDQTLESVQLTTRVAGMRHWCRLVEHMLVDRQLADARVWVGFERLSRIRAARSRYEAIARTCRGLVLFGLPDAEPRIPGAVVEPIHQGALLAEWFLLVDSSRYSALIAAIDLDGLRDETWNRARRFRALVTYEPRAISALSRALEAARAAKP